MTVSASPEQIDRLAVALAAMGVHAPPRDTAFFQASVSQWLSELSPVEASPTYYCRNCPCPQCGNTRPADETGERRSGIPWRMTKDHYPTDADMSRGIVACTLSDAHWMFWDMQMLGNFGRKNFGSPPMYWAYVDEIVPGPWKPPASETSDG